MARLQDFQTVTPATSDNLLIVQSQGQGLSTLNAVGQKVATETTMSSLNTTSKNLVGGINEVKANITGLITTNYTSGQAIANNGTWQIPSAALSHKFIIVEMRRYGYYSAFLVETGAIGQGLVNAVNNEGVWKYSIDANGVFANKTGNNDIPPFVNVWGIF